MSLLQSKGVYERGEDSIKAPPSWSANGKKSMAERPASLTSKKKDVRLFFASRTLKGKRLEGKKRGSVFPNTHTELVPGGGEYRFVLAHGREEGKENSIKKKRSALVVYPIPGKEKREGSITRKNPKRGEREEKTTACEYVSRKEKEGKMIGKTLGGGKGFYTNFQGGKKERIPFSSLNNDEGLGRKGKPYYSSVSGGEGERKHPITIESSETGRGRGKEGGGRRLTKYLLSLRSNRGGKERRSSLFSSYSAGGIRTSSQEKWRLSLTLCRKRKKKGIFSPPLKEKKKEGEMVPVPHKEGEGKRISPASFCREGRGRGKKKKEFP